MNGPVIRPEHIQFELVNDAAGATGAGITVATLPVRVVKRAATAASATSPASNENAAAGSLANSLGQTERDLILDALRTGQGNRREAAERLGISPRTLRYKLARLREAGIDVPAA